MPDIDVNYLSEAINDKADRDVMNLTNSGKSKISDFSSPIAHQNNPYIELAKPASGTRITAPTNGILYCMYNCTSAGGWLTLDNETVYMTSDIVRNPYTNSTSGGHIHCSKDDTIYITYAGCDIVYLRFFPMKGEEVN